jgi:hypothetical protein
MAVRGVPGAAGKIVLAVLLAWSMTQSAGAQRDGQDGDFGPSPLHGSHHLEIVEINAPSWTRMDLPFDVSVTAADNKGIGFIEVRFGTQTFRVPGNGERRASAVVRFQPGTTRLPSDRVNPVVDNVQDPYIHAIAFATDGRTAGEPVVKRITFGPDDVRSLTFDERAAQNYRDMLSDKTYADSTGLILPSGPNIPVAQNDPRPWWIRWQEKGGPTPFNWKQQCNIQTLDPALPDGGGKVLECWLAQHTNVRSHIVWDEVDPLAGGLDPYGTHYGKVTTLSYQNWTQTMKLQLGAAFFFAYEYLHNGTTWFNGQWLPPYPPNQLTLQDSEGAYTVVAHDDAWQLYLGTIAHSLALEVGGFVPWSIVNYKGSDLDVLLNSKSMFNATYLSWYYTDKDIRSAVGYFVEDMVPPPPTTNFEFMLAQDAIRPSQMNTIARYLVWARGWLEHTGAYLDQNGHIILWDGGDAKSAQAYWGFRGRTPATKVQEGTIFTDPWGFTNPKAGWVIGCWGVTFVTQATLRSVNIPVQVDHPGGGHSAPIFWTVNRALSHGDDVYGYAQPKATPMYPAQAILIPISTYNDWFYGAGVLGPAGVANVSRQTEIELPLSWLADDLLQRYCTDKANNATHANGTVAEYFHGVSINYDVKYYTVPQLEALHLWQNLAAKATALGYCGP